MKHVKSNHHHSLHIAAAGALQVAAQIAAMAVGVVLMGYLTRHLGVAEYGRYAVSMQLMNWVGLLFNISTVSVTVRLVAGFEPGRDYAVSMLRWTFGSSLMLAVVFFASADGLAHLLRSPEIITHLQILSFNLIFSAQSGVYSGILIAHNRIVTASIFTAATACAQFVSALVLVGSGMAGAGACLAAVAAQLAYCLAGRMVSGISMLEKTTIGISDLWPKARVLMGTRAGLLMSQGLDLMAVKFITGDAISAGYYAGAKNISIGSNMLFGPSMGVVMRSLSNDRLSGRVEQASQLASFYTRVGLIYAGLLVSLSVLSGDIAVFLLGPDFTHATPVLMLLLFASGGRVLSALGSTLMGSTGDRAMVLIPLLAVVPLSLAGYFFVVPRFGIIGAAAVTLITSITIAIILMTYGLRGLGTRFPLKTAVRVLLAGAITAVFADIMPGDTDWLIAKLAAASLLYVVLLRVLQEWSSTRATATFFTQSLGAHFGAKGAKP